MAKDFFSREEIDEIKAAIAAAENHSSGEIRLHLENHCKEDLMDRAAYIFEQLEMHKTKLRNGVLFYLAIEDHQFAILGDVGINQKVPEGFWDEVRDLMQSEFRKGNHKLALIEGIKMSGMKLKEFFPLADDDKNELSDEISFGK
ncbi:MAG: hypothetical protein CMP59_02420 [Flavobacteriales bacterium]|nr:hypothetical protein [Flavobacteriales bacterium]|tara:strand:+ start:909 stop:1343 length:435 start_codon:yes stop_codon:yes gene_type:complete